jgi:hypothetical protein
MRVLWLVFLLLPALAFGQSVGLNTVSRSDTISADGDYHEFSTALLQGGFGSVKVQTLDSYSGTWEVQCAVDGTNYDTGAELKLSASDSSTTVTSVSDTIGIWDVANASGCLSIRVIATGGFAASDTVVVISATQSGGGGGGGGTTTVDGAFDGVLLDAASGDPLTDTTADALQVLIVDTAGTALTFVDAILFDMDSGGGTQEGEAIGILCAASGGAVLCGIGDGTNGLTVNLGANNDVTTTSDDQQGDDDSIAYSLTVPVVASLLYCDNGTTWERCEKTADPCDGAAKTRFNNSITTATTTEIINEVASSHIYICSLLIQTDAANDVAVVEDEDDACASPAAGTIGGTTAATGLNLQQGSGLTFGTGAGYVLKTNATDRNICIISSAATQLNVSGTFVAAP